jgi:hypothetical protein
LGCGKAIWWATLTVVEDEKQKNQENLISELTPTLHEEGHCNVSATMETYGEQVST